MENKLVHPSKVEVKTSPIHGYGVFAKEDILKNEIIEECYIIKIPLKKNFLPELFVDYKFGWKNEYGEIDRVLPLGFGCIYNHSDNHNAQWKQISEKKVIQFYAIRDIKSGEEIFHYYGDSNYWKTKSKLNAFASR